MASRSFWRYENAVVALLGTTFGLVFYDRVAITFLFPFIAPELHLSHTHLGLISSALALAWAISGALVGAYADRSDRKKTILLVAVVGFSACTALSGAAFTFVALLLVRIAMGVFEGPVLPIAQSIMAAESTPERRGLNMGMVQGVASNIFMIIGPPVTAALATQFGWRQALYLVALPGFGMALLLWLYLRVRSAPMAAPVGAAHRAAPVAGAPSVRELLRHRNIWLGVLVACCLVTWLLTFATFAPDYLVRARGMSGQEMGLVMAATGVAALIWGVVAPMLSDRVGRKPVIAFTTLLGVLPGVLLALWPAPALALAGSMLLVFMTASCFPLVMATVPSETVAPGAVATALGLVMGVGEVVGGVVAPTLAGMGADALQAPSFPLYVSAGAALLGAVLSLFLIETAPRRVNVAPLGAASPLSAPGG